MKIHIKIPLLTILICCPCIPARSQGSFQNLDFESASLVPIPGDLYERVQFMPAFPGWTGYVGGVQQNGALYDNAFLDSSGISILDHATDGAANFLIHGRLIQGNYTALLMAGFALGAFQPADTTLAQTGLIPVGTQSLLFNTFTYSVNPGTFGVALGGQTLSLTPIHSDPNSVLYGADIHTWAGQSAELAFTAFAQDPHVSNIYLFLDSIQFSSQPIPEPSVLGLFTFGTLLLGWRLRHEPKGNWRIEKSGSRFRGPRCFNFHR
jgi:hypothetical protein